MVSCHCSYVHIDCVDELVVTTLPASEAGVAATIDTLFQVCVSDKVTLYCYIMHVAITVYTKSMETRL